MFSFVYHLQITEKPNPAEREPPSEVKAHIKIMSTKLFPMDSVYHISRVSGVSQCHYFVLMSKCFSSPKCRREGHRFPRNGSSVPHCCREKGVTRIQTLTRRGGKVKSITLTISICSTKTANEGVGEGYLRNKSTHTGPLDPSSQSSITH